MSDTPIDNFREAVERIVWAHSNLGTDERAVVLRTVADELEMEDSRFDDIDEHVRYRLREMGYELPEDGNE